MEMELRGPAASLRWRAFVIGRAKQAARTTPEMLEQGPSTTGGADPEQLRHRVSGRPDEAFSCNSERRIESLTIRLQRRTICHASIDSSRSMTRRYFP